jgi:hypothetical protein
VCVGIKQQRDLNLPERICVLIESVLLQPTVAALLSTEVPLDQPVADTRSEICGPAGVRQRVLEMFLCMPNRWFHSTNELATVVAAIIISVCSFEPGQAGQWRSAVSLM